MRKIYCYFVLAFLMNNKNILAQFTSVPASGYESPADANNPWICTTYINEQLNSRGAYPSDISSDNTYGSPPNTTRVRVGCRLAQFYPAYSYSNNPIIIGASSTPTYGVKLEVSGKSKMQEIQITNGAGIGKVLTSSSDGSASWLAIPTPNSGDFNSDVRVQSNKVIEFGAGVSGKEVNAGKIGYGTFSGGQSLDIVGAGSSSTNRKIQFWNEGGATFNGDLTVNNNTAYKPTLILGPSNAGEKIYSNRVSGSADLYSLKFQTNSVDQMVIQLDGNIRMNNGLNVTNQITTNNAINILKSGKTWQMNYDNTGGYYFIDEVGVARQFIIKNGGNVGIGVTNTNTQLTEKLNVIGRVNATQGYVLPDGFIVNSSNQLGANNNNGTLNLNTDNAPNIIFGIGSGEKIYSNRNTNLAGTDKNGLNFMTSNAERMIIQSDGNVRMNNSLNVGGSLNMTGNINATGITVNSSFLRLTNPNLPSSTKTWEFNTATDNGGYFYIDELGNARHFKIKSTTGQVIIGGDMKQPQTDTDYKLAVQGKIVGTEVVATAPTNWADFVFDKNYKLESLKEIETYIMQNKHLRGIPSEKEVKEKGVNLTDMDAKLLQKIEELTLYIISQQKQIDDLQKKVK